MTNLLHHELEDRLNLITDMYHDYIIEHDSDDLLLPEEKQAMFNLLWEQYQLVGKRIYEKSLAEKGTEEN